MRMLLLLGLLAAVPRMTLAADLRGTLELYAAGQPLRASEASDAIVYFRAREPQQAKASPEPVQMSTRRKQFVPRLLAVSAGSTVRFPNEDPILHNAFSVSPDNRFDTGQYGTGSGGEHIFVNPGLVKVYCNVHHSMFGFILVLDTPYFTRADAQGRFDLRGLPETEGELVVFHDRAQPWRQAFTPGAVGELAIRVDLNKRKVPPHMNKFGKPYRRSANASGY